MSNSKFLYTVGLLATTIVSLSACSQQPATVGTNVDTYKEQSTTTVTVDRNTGAESRSTTTEVLTPGVNDPAHVDVRTGDSRAVINVESDGEGNFSARTEPETTHVRAPFFKMDKNEDSGSVHIKVPFVRIDKSPGGRAHVDIGTHH